MTTIMKKLVLLLAMIFGVMSYMWADVTVKTMIYDSKSQPMLVGGFIENYSNKDVKKKGIIVSKSADNMIITADTDFDNATIFLQGKSTGRINDPHDIRFIDCTDTNEEQFACALQFLFGNTDYYVKAFAIDKYNNVFYGSTEKVHTLDYSRYDGWADYANVWYAFDYTLFDVVTDEIIDPNNGFYYTTNENPQRVSHQTGTSYNTCYKLATEWNYKLWYCQCYHGTLENNSSKVVHLPVMSYSNGVLTIEKSKLDADKDITIYYSINGNYFRPETFTEIYSQPLNITASCTVCCYAVSSEGYVSYTNIYSIGDGKNNGEDVSNSGYKSLDDYIANSVVTQDESKDFSYSINPAIKNVKRIFVDLTKGTTNSLYCYLGIKNNINKKEIYFSSKYLKTSSDNLNLVENGNYKGRYNIKKLADDRTLSFVYYNPENTNEIIIDVSEYFGCLGYIADWQRNFGTSSIVNIETAENNGDNNTDYSEGADIVDLGLSVKWASWNVGAGKPEELGNLYAWGELEPKNNYSSSTYKFYDGDYIKYGDVDNKYRLDREDDVAQQKWGDKWRIPTFEELKELKEKCTFTKAEVNGVLVTKVTGPNGNYIYFPYPGNYTGTTLYFKNSIGSYWSSDLESNSYAKDIDFDNGTVSLNGDTRYHGQSIRPVYDDNYYVPNPNANATVPDVVDLGLTSGLLWAAWNIGASIPEEYGTYFAWGETVPKDSYDWSTYKFGNGSNFSKYNNIDGLTELELEDDAAYVILGKDWRMPTHADELELVNECSWESVTVNGVSGYKITGPNGNSIFMPRGGLYDGTDYGSDGTKLSSADYGGWYWSSTLNSKGSSYARGLCFFPSLISNVSDHERCDGHNIRPVYVGDANNSSSGISTMAIERINDGIYYNLQGQRVEKPRNGIYILNGKKVFIK